MQYLSRVFPATLLTPVTSLFSCCSQEKLIAPLIATHNADFELEETKAKVDYGTKKHKWLVVHSVILHKMDCVP